MSVLIVCLFGLLHAFRTDSNLLPYHPNLDLRARSPSSISAFREVNTASAPLQQAECSRSSRKDDIRRFYELATKVNSTGVKDTIMNKMDDHPFTDKVTGHHYELMYGMFLLPLQNSPVPPKILEIGLGCGYPWGTGVSQRLWRSMFPESEVWGADLTAECVEKSRTAEENKGIQFLQGDQADFKTLDRWVEETGGADFDVIIDDGGHSNLMIMHSFEGLFPKMKPGGLYFMEDLQLGRSADVPGHIFDDTKGIAVVIDILKDWMEQLVVRKEDRKPTVHPVPEGVAFVFCQSEACVIGKDVGNVRPHGAPSLLDESF